MDQAKNPVAGCESRNEPFAMFDHSALEIVCHAGVQVSRPARKNVNAIGAVHFRPRKSRSLTLVPAKRGRVRDDTRAGGRHHSMANTFKLSIPRSSMSLTAMRLLAPASKGSETIPRYFSIRSESISAFRLRASRAQP